ncbi:hypothetical protein ACHWQZ_G004690 [Mnemiopsis leidyi]
MKHLLYKTVFIDSPPPSPPPPLSEDQIKMETVSNDTGLPSSQPPSYSSSTHTPDLDFYPTKYNDQTALITRSRDLTGSRDFKGSRDFNMRPSAFSKFTRDPNLDHDPVFAPYQQLPVVDNRSINSLSRDQLNSLSRDHPRDLNSLSRDYMNSLSRDHMNSLSRDPRDRVLSDGAIMKQGLLHSASLPRNQLGGSQISGLVSPPAYNALSPQPCPQTRGYASSMPFLDSDHYNSEKRAARSHSPMSECSRTTNTSRISLAKRAIHNSHRHNSDDQSQHGSSNQDHIDLSHIMQILTTSTNGKLLSSAAGCLQHMAYNHDHMKARIRDVGGIPILVRLLQAEEEVSLSALGALRNLSYGQQNNINKIAIKDAHGVPLLVQLMKTSDNFEIQELITGVFWNLSSSDQVKPQLLRQALEPIVKSIIIPQSGWKGSQIKHELSGELIPCTTVFRNATGCLRNLSSAGLEGRQVMRSCYGLVDSLLFVLRCVHGKNDVDNKAVENSVCILRNLSYRLESEVSPEHKYGQVEDWRSRGLGGGQFKRKDPGDEPIKKKKNTKKHKGKENATPLPEHTNGVGLLWQPSVVRVYLDLLLECSNPETLEGAAGTLQNLTACSWEPAQLLREAVRREKGLSVISSLLRMSNDIVVRSIAVCLRNLASDSKNKELLGQNTLSDLVNRLPGGEGADGITDMTIGAIISTILELVTGSPETARLLKVQNGIPRLVDISRSTDVYSGQCVHVSNRVLAACWEIRDLRKFLKLKGWNIGMLQRLPPTDRTDGLEYDETKNQFKASYNDGLNRPHQNTLTRQRSPGRHLSPDRHRSPTRHLSPHHGRRVLSPSGYDHNTHRAATMGRAMDPSLGYHRPERPFEDYDMARGQSLPARSLPPTHPLNSNYGVADSWV